MNYESIIAEIFEDGATSLMLGLRLSGKRLEIRRDDFWDARESRVLGHPNNRMSAASVGISGNETPTCHLSCQTVVAMEDAGMICEVSRNGTIEILGPFHDMMGELETVERLREL